MAAKRSLLIAVRWTCRLSFLIAFAGIHAICTHVLAVVNSWYDQWTTPGTWLIQRAFEISTVLFRWLPATDPADFDGVKRVFFWNGLLWALAVLVVIECAARLFIVFLRWMGAIPPKQGVDVRPGGFPVRGN